MDMEMFHLTEQEQAVLQRMSQQTGKTPEELVHDAVKQWLAQFQQEDRLHLLRQARGMWKDRTDLPKHTDLCREWDHAWKFFGSPNKMEVELWVSGFLGRIDAKVYQILVEKRRREQVGR